MEVIHLMSAINYYLFNASVQYSLEKLRVNVNLNWMDGNIVYTRNISFQSYDIILI